MSLMKVIEDMIELIDLNDKMDQNKQLLLLQMEYMIYLCLPLDKVYPKII